MDSRSEQTRIALIGCGAIAQTHARALSGVAGARCTAVYDISPERAASFRQTFCPEAEVARSLDAVIEQTDAAIVAVPNALHAPVSIALMRGGLHVLCEKPLAVSLTDAREMVSVAKEQGRVLTCGLVRRFFDSTVLVSEALSRNLVGLPVSFETRESVWDGAFNRAMFDRAITGGGILIDIGPHALDLLNLWFGSIEVLEYRDDARPGVEAFSYARLRCGSGVVGSVHLTRAYGTINHTRITCERGYIDFSPKERDRISIVYTDGAEPFQTTAQAATPRDPFVKQLENFLGAIGGEVELVVPAAAALSAVATIEACYEKRQPLIELWSAEAGASIPGSPAHSYKKILLTGASGSVGSRMIEMWAAEGRLDSLRCMVRSYRSAARIMRYPVEIVEADLTDAQAIRRAAEGCDAIVHLGVGDKAARETQSLLDAARTLGIRRFVHMSTAALYGIRMPSSIEALQEKTKVVKTGEPYADEKARAERAVMRACERGLEAVILRPHMVYGPALRWSAELMQLLAQNKIGVLDDGGWCNLIYVDDLVRAVWSGLVAEKGFGEPLFVTDGAPLRWSEYIEAHAALIGAMPPRVLSKDVLRGKLSLRDWVKESVKPLPAIIKSREFRNFVFESPAIQAAVFPFYLQLRESQKLQPLIEKLRGDGTNNQAPSGQGEFHPLWVELQTSEARLSSERVQALIGFRAQVDFREGLRRSADWFKQFGLMSSREETDEHQGSPTEVFSTAS